MSWLILTVVLLAFILLTVAFRSIVIATKAAALNLLSVGAAYGVVAAIFQWGWGGLPHLTGPRSMDKLPTRTAVSPWASAITPNLDIEGSEHLARISREEQAALTRTPRAQ